ncbi:MAG: ABC-2 transporter permease, partial [Oscillospiraceae bacterium]|nr:ABC-2 transporter permease [Oscillospiraceae bacterium]
MFGLIIKQLRLQRIHIILLSLGIVAVAVLSFFFSYFSISSEELDPNSTILPLFLLLYISADAVSTSFFTTDESKKWASFIISSPLGARGQVKSQYLLTIFMLFAVNTAC